MWRALKRVFCHTAGVTIKWKTINGNNRLTSGTSTFLQEIPTIGLRNRENDIHAQCTEMKGEIGRERECARVSKGKEDVWCLKMNACWAKDNQVFLPTARSHTSSVVASPMKSSSETMTNWTSFSNLYVQHINFHVETALIQYYVAIYARTTHAHTHTHIRAISCIPNLWEVTTLCVCISSV